MKSRCLRPSDKRYHDYGGRGIKIYEEWLNFIPFLNWAVTNGFQEGLTLERCNVNGNYEPKNCRWATNVEQANNKRNNKLLSYNDITMNMKQWSDLLDIPYPHIKDRVRRGQSIEFIIKKFGYQIKIEGKR